jgi:hypothetical protein
MEDESQSRPPAESFDAVLRKYGKIWIWSILITAAFTYFMRSTAYGGMLVLNMRDRALRYDPALWVPAAATTIDCVATGLSLFWLFQFMVYEILPLFFSVEENSTAPGGAQLLHRAFGGMLVGLASQAASYVVTLVWKLNG